jgi:hypothetical protein
MNLQMMMMLKRTNKVRRTKMTSQTDPSKSSDRTLEELRKEFRRLSKERKQSKKPFLKAQSLTLKELRKLGINTEPTLIVSFGRRKK